MALRTPPLYHGKAALSPESIQLSRAPDDPAALSTGNDEQLLEVYFGCGCFWHVQHEFVMAEQRILGRVRTECTARTGYAGGKGGTEDGKVCYHNRAGVADYGSLGHAEVVGLRIPAASYPDFAKEYTRLFTAKGFRPDQLQDRGPEYRNLVGIPGGAESGLARQLVQASQAAGDKLNFAVGEGDDIDARNALPSLDSCDWRA